MIYKLLLSIRNARYKGGRKSVKAPVPTVCVGNITVGGTGKTPHIEMLLRELNASDTWGPRNVAVLSRGYKRRSKGYRELLFDASAKLYGDEPVQVRRKFLQTTVAVCKNRIEGCRRLAENGAELILLDDAYQYRKLAADMNIVLVDWSRPVTRDSLLPWGRLRDLRSRLYDAEAVIVSKCPYAFDPQEKAEYATLLGYDSYDAESCTAAKGGKKQLLLFSGIDYEHLLPVFEEADTRYVYSKKLVLFTGIADDTPMRNYLSDTYKIVEHLHFPDHHRYNRGDMRTLKATLKRNPTAAFVTTEKDAQRLRDLSKIPDELRERMFFLPISVNFPEERERQALIEKLITL